MTFLYFAILVACLFLAANKVHNKIIGTLIVFCAILMGASMQVGYDTENYRNAFDDFIYYGKSAYEIDSKLFSPFYCFLEDVFIGIGVRGFYLFKFILYIILSFLIYKGLHRFSFNGFLLIFLYLIGPFFDDAMQVRNTISVAILTFILPLLYSQSKRSWVPLLLVLLLVVFNHLSFIIFSIFLLIKLNKQKIIKVAFVVGLFLYFYVFIFQNFSLFSYLQNLLAGQKLGDNSLFEETTRMGSLLAFAYYGINYYLVRMCNKHIQSNKYNVQYYNGVDIKRVSCIIYDITRLMSLPLFICVLSLTSIRFYRDVTFFWLIEYTLALNCNVMDKKNRIVVFGMSICAMLYFMCLSNFIMGPPEDIIFSVFNGNLSWLLNL